MALSKLSGDEAGIIFGQLCNVFEPRVAVAFSSASQGLWAATHALRQQLRTDHEAAAALCRKAGLRSWKELREAKKVEWRHKVVWWLSNGLNLDDPKSPLSATDLTRLVTLCSVLPKLQVLYRFESGDTAGPDGVQRLAAGLQGADALPALTTLTIIGMHVSDAGATALGAALVRDALPRLTTVFLASCGIGDAGLVALAPALRQLSAYGCPLTRLSLAGNPIGDEGIAALVAPPPPTPLVQLTGVPLEDARTAANRRSGVLFSLKKLYLSQTQITDRGCAALAHAFDRCSLLGVDELALEDIPAGAAAKAEVQSFLE